MENFQIYRDIQARTGGDIYIGVVGPVRTGKSTFIRRFMELVALPAMEPGQQAEVRDQLPLSGSGKLITTVEPKFIPKEAIPVTLGEDQKVQIKLIDCVGFLSKTPPATSKTEESGWSKLHGSKKPSPSTKPPRLAPAKLSRNTQRSAS